MKKLIILILGGILLQLTSCFIIPIVATNYAEDMKLLDKGFIGDYHGEQNDLTYDLTIQSISDNHYKGTIAILQEKDTINQCTFSRIDNKYGSGIAESARLFCEKDSVNGVFSMQLNQKATSLTIFGVSHRLDLAIPNNLTLIKKRGKK